MRPLSERYKHVVGALIRLPLYVLFVRRTKSRYNAAAESTQVQDIRPARLLGGGSAAGDGAERTEAQAMIQRCDQVMISGVCFLTVRGCLMLLSTIQWCKQVLHQVDSWTTRGGRCKLFDCLLVLYKQAHTCDVVVMRLVCPTSCAAGAAKPGAPDAGGAGCQDGEGGAAAGHQGADSRDRQANPGGGQTVGRGWGCVLVLRFVLRVEAKLQLGVDKQIQAVAKWWARVCRILPGQRCRQAEKSFAVLLVCGLMRQRAAILAPLGAATARFQPLCCLSALSA